MTEDTTADPDDCSVSDPALHAKLTEVAAAIAERLGIPPDVVGWRCEEGGVVELPLAVAEVLLWQAEHTATVGDRLAEELVNRVSRLPDAARPPDGAAPLQGPFFP